MVPLAAWDIIAKFDVTVSHLSALLRPTEMRYLQVPHEDVCLHWIHVSVLVSSRFQSPNTVSYVFYFWPIVYSGIYVVVFSCKISIRELADKGASSDIAMFMDVCY